MNYTTLGKTGLNVSRLSFGASALGGVFRDIDEADGIRAVHAAHGAPDDTLIIHDDTRIAQKKTRRLKKSANSSAVRAPRPSQRVFFLGGGGGLA